MPFHVDAVLITPCSFSQILTTHPDNDSKVSKTMMTLLFYCVNTSYPMDNC